MAKSEQGNFIQRHARELSVAGIVATSGLAGMAVANQVMEPIREEQNVLYSARFEGFDSPMGQRMDELADLNVTITTLYLLYVGALGFGATVYFNSSRNPEEQV